MKRKVLVTLIIVVIIVVTLLEWKFEDVARVTSSTMFGVLFKVILASLLLPQGKEILQTFFKSRKINECKDLVKYGENSIEFKNAFVNLLKNDLIDSTYLNNLKAEKAAIMILGLQYHYEEIEFSEELDSYDLIKIAERASESEWYRDYLMSTALKMFFGSDASTFLIEKLLIEKKSFIRVRSESQNADNLFLEKLSNANDEILYINSTTSQISDISLNMIKINSRKIKEIKMFMVSPLVLSDKGLMELVKEYDLPNFTIPKGQFVSNLNIDVLRRCIRILISISNLLEFKEDSGINLSLSLYNDRYPGMKIRVLSDRSYMQVFPAPLKYANNLYRFGYEINNKDLIDIFIKNIDNESDSCKAVKLEKEDVNELEENAIKEIVWFLLTRNVNINEVKSYRSDLELIINNPKVNYYLDRILDFWNEMLEFGNTYKINKNEFLRLSFKKPIFRNGEIVEIYDENEKCKHISVGVILVSEGKLLLINKNKEPYKGKKSIVAGHLEWGETPYQGIIREVKEEIGLDLLKLDFLVSYEDESNTLCRYGTNRHFWFLFKCTIDREISKKVFIDNKEIDSIEWIEKDKLKRVNNLTGAAKIALEKSNFL